MMIVYPEEGYNSWIAEDEADAYFEMRLNSDEWWTANKEAALITAFRSLQDLDIVIGLSDLAASQAIKDGQAEQALWELKNNRDQMVASDISLAGFLSVKIPADGTTARYSSRTMAILRPFIQGRAVLRTR